MTPNPILCFLILASLLGAGTAHARKYTYVDGHVHVVDFFQQGAALPELLIAMDDAGVSAAVVMGLPVAKQWHEDEPKRPRYYQGDDAPLYWYSATDVVVAEAVQKLPASQRARLYPFLCGFNPNDKNATAHLERMLELYPGLWRGIGEVFTRHDDLTALTQDEVPRANNEAMMRVYEFAARHQLPVLVHSNITSQREPEALYRDEWAEALRRNPKTHFIWAHAGTSAEIHRTQGRLQFLRRVLAELLEDYPNLWVDLSWAVLDPYLLDAQGRPQADWLRLIRRYPERFVLGSDVLGRYDSLGQAMSSFDVFLDALPPKVAEQLAHRNLETLLRVPPRAAGAGAGKARATVQVQK